MDWSGKCGNGGVYGGVQLRPVPIIHDDCVMHVEREHSRLRWLLTPPDPFDAAGLFAALQGRYHCPTLPPPVIKEIKAQDAEHMQEYPLFLIKKACDLWMKDPKRHCIF